MYKKRYRISIVNYLNTLPFVYGIKHSGIEQHLDISYDIPSECARKLLDNEVDIGLVPVAILTKMPEYHIITDFCIGSNGKVDSVKLFSQVSLNEIRTILLDYQSRTSVALVQVLCRDLWHIEPEFISAKEGFEKKIDGTTAAVIIGDRTFSINNTYPYEYDLAEEWKKLTGLPFAFATWTSGKVIEDKKFMEDFNNALEFGVKSTGLALVEYANPYPDFDAMDYLRNKISHHLDVPKKEAVTKFLNLLNSFNFQK